MLKGLQGWLTTLLLSGFGVALFTFAAPIVWNKVAHRSVGPAYVEASLRVENGTIYLLVRNSSDDPLDLVEADLAMPAPKPAATRLGAYPEPSHLYQVSSSTGAGEIEQTSGQLSVKLKIAQSIKAGEVDQFAVSVVDFGAVVTPSSGSLSGRIVDIMGHAYPAKY